MSQKKFSNFDDFIAFHERIEDIVYRRISNASGKWTIEERIYEDFLQGNAVRLPAVNCRARIAVGREIYHWFRTFYEGRSGDDWYFVTLCPRQFVVPLTGAAAFDVEELRVWVEALFERCEYFGCIEGAYYPDGRGSSFEDPALISWHAHLIVWGIGSDVIQAKIDELNRRYQALVPNARAADHKPLSKGRGAGAPLYMTKGPFFRYKVITLDPHKAEQASRRGGGNTRIVPRLFDQKSEFLELRPGDVIRVASAFHGRVIPDLLFGANDGAKIITQSLKRAVQSINEQDWRKASRLADLIA